MFHHEAFSDAIRQLLLYFVFGNIRGTCVCCVLHCGRMTYWRTVVTIKLFVNVCRSIGSLFTNDYLISCLDLVSIGWRNVCTILVLVLTRVCVGS